MGATTTLTIEPLEGVTFGAWVRDFDVRTLDEESFAALHDAWMEYGLLIFPDQFLSRDEQNEFARWFGDLANATPSLTSDNSSNQNARFGI